MKTAPPGAPVSASSDTISDGWAVPNATDNRLQKMPAARALVVRALKTGTVSARDTAVRLVMAARARGLAGNDSGEKLRLSLATLVFEAASEARKARGDAPVEGLQRASIDFAESLIAAWKKPKAAWAPVSAGPVLLAALHGVPPVAVTPREEPRPEIQGRDRIQRPAPRLFGFPAVRSPADPPLAHAPEHGPWYAIKSAAGSLSRGLPAPIRTLAQIDVATRIVPKLQLGDIVLRRTDTSETNMLIPGNMKHAGIYVGQGQVVDSMAPGVRERPLQDFFSESDAIIIVRARGLSPEQRQAAVAYALRNVGAHFDYGPDFESTDAFVCTELAYRALGAATPEPLLDFSMDGSDRVIYPDAFDPATNPRFELVWKSAP